MSEPSRLERLTEGANQLGEDLAKDQELLDSLKARLDRIERGYAYLDGLLGSAAPAAEPSRGEKADVSSYQELAMADYRAGKDTQ